MVTEITVKIIFIGKIPWFASCLVHTKPDQRWKYFAIWRNQRVSFIATVFCVTIRTFSSAGLSILSANASAVVINVWSRSHFCQWYSIAYAHTHNRRYNTAHTCDCMYLRAIRIACRQNAPKTNSNWTLAILRLVWWFSFYLFIAVCFCFTLIFSFVTLLFLSLLLFVSIWNSSEILIITCLQNN